jgi:hypothetical protein
VETILVDRCKKPWEVIHGNGRLQAALDLGWTTIAANIVDVDDATPKAMAVVLNCTGKLAAWDKRDLDKLLREVHTSAKLTAMLAELAQEQGVAREVVSALTDPDTIPEPPDEPLTRPGDHRLLCGDAVRAADVDRLLDGGAVHLVHTDPPYNVRVEPRSNAVIAAGLSSLKGIAHHQPPDPARHPGKARRPGDKLRPRDRALANDFVADAEFERLLHAWFGNLARVLLPGRAFYLWGGYTNVGNYTAALKAAGLYFSQAIIWDRQHAVLTRKD